MLEETRRELAEAKERSQLTPTHTFSPLPGFFDRPAELRAISRALEGEPSFTVLFGASSVGKVSHCIPLYKHSGFCTAESSQLVYELPVRTHACMRRTVDPAWTPAILPIWYSCT